MGFMVGGERGEEERKMGRNKNKKNIRRYIKRNFSFSLIRGIIVFLLYRLTAN